MPPKTQKATAVGRLIGYARVSTEDQGTDPQTDELRAAGCTIVREEHASGADRARPVLARLLRDIAAGDPVAICKVLARRDATWLPIVRRIRPAQPWGDVVRVLNQKPGAVWTVERLRRTVRRLAAEGIVKADLLDRARPQGGADRLVRLVAGIKTVSPDWTLQQMGIAHGR
jgi:resolvase-like protein